MFDLMISLLALAFLVLPLAAFVRARAAQDQVKRLTGMLDAMQRRVDRLEREAIAYRAMPPVEPSVEPMPEPVAFADPLPLEEPAGLPESVEAEMASEAVAAEALPEPTGLGPQPSMPDRVWTTPSARAPRVEKKPARSRAEWEALVGGQVLNRVGALALILGIGYFLKYAFDNEWIGPAMRVLIGVAAGTALQVGGWVFHRRKLPIFAQGLTGAGIAVLYLCVYAAFNFYGLVSQPTALGLMSAITVLAFAQAISTDSLAVSLLGWAGGVLTPFMLSTGQVNEPGLFGYLALFSLGMFAVSSRQERRTANDHAVRWTVLEPLTLAVDLIILGSWYDRIFQVGHPTGVALAFLLAIWAMAFVADARRSLSPTAEPLDPVWVFVRHATAIVNAGAVLLGIVGLITGDRTRAAAFVGLGLAYAGLWFALDRRGARPVAVTRACWSAVAFVVTAIAFGVDGNWITGGWTVLALGLMAVGLRTDRDAVWQAGLVVLTFALLRLLFDPVTWTFEPVQAFRPVLNPRALTVAVVTAGFAGGAWLMGRWGRSEYPRQTFAPLLNVCWIALLFLLLTAETNDAFRHRLVELAPGDLQTKLEYLRPLMMAMVWLMLALPLVRWGRDRSQQPVQIVGLALLALSTVVALGWGWSYDPVSSFVPVLNPRALTFSLVAAALGLSAAWQRSASVRLLLVSATIFVGFALLTVETNDAFRHRMVGLDPGDLRTKLEFLRPLMMTTVWLMLALVLLRWGRDRRQPLIETLGLCLLALAAFVGIGSGWDYHPTLQFVPVVNPRALVFCMVIAALGLAAAWQRTGRFRSVLVGAALFFGFALLTVETVDGFDVPMEQVSAPNYLPESTATITGNVVEMHESPGNDSLFVVQQQALTRLRNGRQLALSGVWLGYAGLLLGLGWWRRSQTLRMVALGLIGLVVVKVALVDLSFLATPYRIVCFIGLALFLLAVSYLYQRYPQLFLDDVVPTPDAPPELLPDAPPASPTFRPDESP